MSEMKDKIIEELDKCLVTEDEWQAMLKYRMTQMFKTDPWTGAPIPQQEAW